MQAARWMIVGSWALGACAGAATEGGSASDTMSAHAARERPSERGMAHAIDRVMPDARSCLRVGDPSVMIAGEFDGASGHFRVTRVASGSAASVPPAIETCVRAVGDRAHVRPFRVTTVAYTFLVAAPGAGAGTSSSTSGGGTGSTSSSAWVNVGGGSTSSGGSGTNSSTVAASGGSSGGSGAQPGRPSPASLIRAESDTYQQCYEQALERDHRIEGTVTVRMVLDRTGNIERLACEVDTDHPDPTLMQIVRRCVEQRVRAIQFGPQYDPGNEVVVPLTFNPGGVRR